MRIEIKLYHRYVRFRKHLMDRITLYFDKALNSPKICKLMKNMKLIVLAFVITHSSCNKQGAPVTEKLLPDENGTIYQLSTTILPRQASVCINSFEDFTARIGSGKPVKSALLENGQLMKVGRDAVRLYYFASNTQQANSLFQSHFITEYADGGQIVAHTQEVWSLGCLMQKRGNPPFTNISSNNTIYLINTSFIWSVPPLASKGYRIIMLNL